MKVDFSAVLLDLDDKPIKATDKENDPTEATLAIVARQALQSVDDPRNPDSAVKKLQIFDLLLLVREGGVIDITPEQATLIKEKIGMAYGPVIVGRSTKLLNGS